MVPGPFRVHRRSWHCAATLNLLSLHGLGELVMENDETKQKWRA